MNTPLSESPKSIGASVSQPPAPVTKWWGRVVVDGNPPQRRLVIRWPRIFLAAFSLALMSYLALATALWGYYSFYRKIPDVALIDIVVLPRFSHVQAAIGAHYHAQAKQLWEQRDYVKSILTARASVQKSPANLEARLFLAKSWQQAGRFDEAVRALRDGIAFHAENPVLQKALVETCLITGRHAELLVILREALPARGVRLLDGRDPAFALAEVRAVLETEGPLTAEKVVATRSALAELPAAAPLLARIDWELNRRDNAIKRLAQARVSDPKDIGVHDSYVDMAMRLGRSVEAREASAAFLKAYPNLPMAQLRFLEAHSSRQGADRTLWMNECLRYLVQYRRTPGALERLASLAAPQGWTDLAYLLYQNSLQDNLNGFPFAIYYAASLVKAREFTRADAAMIAWGVGNQSEATQILERLHRETTSEPRRRESLVQLFKDFGFPEIAGVFERLP
jgi:tetratricopeptide (TPR) repeat protein